MAGVISYWLLGAIQINVCIGFRQPLDTCLRGNDKKPVLCSFPPMRKSMKSIRLQQYIQMLYSAVNTSIQ